MAKSVNKVILLGNAGKDPEIKSTTGGTLVAYLSLATSERYKDKGGEWQERTEWHSLVAYSRGAEILRDYVKKGSKLYVEGKLTTRSWDDKNSGKRVYRTEVVAGDISLLSANDRSEGREPNDGKAHKGNRRDNGNRSSNGSSRGSRYDDPADEHGGVGITDDDVAF
jgi:single-strand DNA-binding protein